MTGVDGALKNFGLTKYSLRRLVLELGGETYEVFQPRQGELSEDDIDEAIRLVECLDFIRKNISTNKEEIINEVIDCIKNKNICAQIATLVFMKILNWYEVWFSHFSSEEKQNRIRRYRLNLVRFNLENQELLLSVEKFSLEKWVDFFIKNNGDFYNKLVAHYVIEMIYSWTLIDILDSPDRNALYYDELRRACTLRDDLDPQDEDFEPKGKYYKQLVILRLEREFSLNNLEEAILTSISSAVDFTWETIKGSDEFNLDYIEQDILGLVVNAPSRDDKPIPRGDAPSALNEGLQAAVYNGWRKDEDGILGYRTKPLSDGFTINFRLSRDGIEPITIFDEAKRYLKAIDPFAVDVWNAVLVLAEQSSEPWSDILVMDIDEILKLVPLGRLSRSSKANQVNATVRALESIERVQVWFEWSENDKSFNLVKDTLLKILTTHEVWREDIASWKHKSVSVKVRIAFGEWVKSARAINNGHRDIWWLGYLPEAVLTQRASLKKLLYIWYAKNQRTEFSVYEWLVGAKGQPYVEHAIKDRRTKSRLMKEFKEAITAIKPKLKPSFEIEKSKDWLKALVRTSSEGTGTQEYMPSLRELRLKLGLTQKEVASRVNYAQNTVSVAERNPDLNATAAGEIKKFLEEEYLDGLCNKH